MNVSCMISARQGTSENISLFPRTNKNIKEAWYRHSGLSGIFFVNSRCNPRLEKDSGQAGMTEEGQGSLSSNVALLMHFLVT
jgi:hypothetical protein